MSSSRTLLDSLILMNGGHETRAQELLPELHGCRSMEGCAMVLFVRLHTHSTPPLTSDVPCARTATLLAFTTHDNGVYLDGFDTLSQTMKNLKRSC